MNAFSHFLMQNIRVIALVVGIFGAIVAQLPDLAPYSNLVSFVPQFGALDAGFANLNLFDAKDKSGNQLALLEPNEKGYAEIYDLLRIFNPSIPVRQELGSNRVRGDVGTIISNSPLTWSNSGVEIPIVRPIQLVVFQNDSLVALPICQLSDIAYVIRDMKVRFYSSLGILLTIAALVLSFIFGETSPSLPNVEIASLGVRTQNPGKKISAKKFHYPIMKVLFIASLAIIIAFLWKNLQQ